MKFELITADELIKRMEVYKFKQLHIHHTWKPERKDFNGINHEKLQNGIRDYHVLNNGWDDIGQHVTLYPDGLFGAGRDFDKTPCSIKGWNTGAFCIEMIGNFDNGKEPFDGIQKDAALKVSNYFGGKYGYDAIKFHRDNIYAAKSCPGSGIDKDEFIKGAKEFGKNQAETVRFNLFGQKIVKIKGSIIDGSAFVKARELLEAMEFDVGWEEASKTILVKKGR